MAGHSKWANIKHRKAAADAKKSKVTTSLVKEITIAAKGGGDPDSNPRLRLAMEKARESNVPKDNVERAIKRGTGELEGVNYEELRFEGYGINGAGVIVDCLTDNKVRTVAEVRHAFTKHGGNLGTDGCVAFQFKHCGQIIFAPGVDEDAIVDVALEVGADDVVDEGDEWVLLTTHDKLFHVAAALKDKHVSPKSQKFVYQPSTTLTIADPAVARQLVRLYETLDEYDDTQNVFANFELTDEAAEALAS